jgi:phosphotransferase family enzyme
VSQGGGQRPPIPFPRILGRLRSSRQSPLASSVNFDALSARSLFTGRSQYLILVSSSARPDLDPTLPALPLAFDLEALSGRFEEEWRRIGGEPVAVSGCRRADTRYEPGVRCVTAYELTGYGPSGANVRTFGVLDVRPSGATHRVFPDDPELAALQAAASSEMMRERLAALADDVTGLRAVEQCEITPIKYKPGQRCVLRYDLRSQRKGVALFGKLVVGGGEQLFATLATLHDSRKTTPAMPRVARPLFHWPDLELVLQSPVTAPSLSSRALDASSPIDVGTRLMRSAGSGLAALHRGVTATGPRRTLKDDARELEGYGTLFGQLAPRLELRFEQAVAAIHAYAATNSEPPPVASHGALRTDQFLVDGDRGLVLMDLDGFCWANPARDLGNLLAYLDWRAIRRPEDAVLIDEVRRAFLDGYATIAPVPSSSDLAAFRAASMLKIAGRRFQRLDFEEWELVPQLLDAAWRTLKLSRA